MKKSGLNASLLIDRVLIMRKQEEDGYFYSNYIVGSKLDMDLYSNWREKICHWSYNVVDHFNLSREIVAISMSLFDRFVATQGAECDGNLALLVSLTTLHLAVKLHETKKIKLSTLASLSRGQFGPEDIEVMEWEILKALKWNVHPPTTVSFISHLLLFLPVEVRQAVRKDLFEMSRYLTELSVCDTALVEVKPSSIAYAIILSVMEEMGYSCISAGMREKFIRLVRENVGLDPKLPEVMHARERLFGSLARTLGCTPCDEDLANTNGLTLLTSSEEEYSFLSEVINVPGSIDSITAMVPSCGGRPNRARASSAADGNINLKRGFSSSARAYGTPRHRRSLSGSSPIQTSRFFRGSSPIIGGAR
jgi:hypothetical protein